MQGRARQILNSHDRGAILIALFVVIAVALAACGGGGPYARSTGKDRVYAGSYMPQPKPKPLPYEVVVRPGDNLYYIARRHQVPLRALIDANRLQPPYRLYPGQKLTVPKTNTHKVQRGDSLYSVSRQYSVDAAMLASLNGLGPPYVIYPGQELRLPATAVSGGAPWALPEQRTAQRSASQKNTPAPAPKKVAGTPVPQPKPAVPPPPSRGTGKMLWPVQGKIISRYGPKEGGLHNDGINIEVSDGAEIRSADNGVVAYAGNELKGFGNLLLIRHQDGLVTAYAHNSKLLVKRGDTVKRGQVISHAGRSGSVASPQLHFEVRKGTKALDPMSYLS